MIFFIYRKTFSENKFFRRLIYLLCQGLDFVKNGDIFAKNIAVRKIFGNYIVVTRL